MLLCKFCSSQRKNENSLRNHERLCKLNPNKGTHSGGRRVGSTAWNRGLSKDTDARVAKMSRTLSATQTKQVQDGTYVPRRMGQAARLRLSESQSLYNRGGRSKWFEVSGIKVQGTWERDVAVKLTELGIVWLKPKTNTDLFKYELDGKVRSYAPDFYLPDLDIYLEVKGYWWGNDKNKMKAVMEQHPYKTIVIIEQDEFNKLMVGELVW